ncbi:MAG: protein kinase [Myxococcales bacterium]
MEPTAHPSNDELLAFAAGRAGPASPAIEAHLDTCRQCRQVLAAAATGSALPAPARLPPSGESVGRYRVRRALGAGAMGVVLEAEDPVLQRLVALKLVRVEGEEAHALAEARLLARLTHPNVVSVFDVGTWSGYLFLAMELATGGTLRDWLREPRALPLKVSLLLQVGEALAAAHRIGIVHRDVKPDNVLVGVDGRARLADFGVARLAPVSGELRTSRAGTPAYMAPELFGEVAPDAASDQYSFCVTCFEAFTGSRPYASTSADSPVTAQVAVELRDRGVPADVAAAVARGLSADPRLRWGSVDELLESFRPKRRSRRRVVAATVLVCALLGTGAWAFKGPLARARRCAALRPWSAEPVARGLRALATSARVERWERGQSADLVAVAERWDQAFAASVDAVCEPAAADAWVDEARLSCLERSRVAAEAWLGSARVEPAPPADELILRGVNLPRPGECANVALLLARRAAGLAGAGADGDLVERIAQAQALRDQLQVREAERRVPGLLTEARAAGAPGVLARALALDCAVKTRTDRAAALPSCAEAFALFDSTGLDEEAAAAASNAMLVAVAAPGESVERWHALARAKLERVGSPPMRLAELRNRWGAALWEQGRLEEALVEYTAALELRRAIYGESHTLTELVAGNRALALADLGRLAEARQELEACELRQRRVLPQGDPRRLRALDPLGYVLYTLEDWEALLPVSEQTVALRAAALDNDVQAYAGQAWRALALLGLGRQDAAREALGRSREAADRVLKPGDPRLGTARMYEAEFALRAGDAAAAAPRLEEARALVPVADDLEAPTRLAAGAFLSLAAMATGEDGRAEQLATEVLADRRSRTLRLVRARAEWALAQVAWQRKDADEALRRATAAELLARDARVLEPQIRQWREQHVADEGATSR